MNSFVQKHIFIFLMFWPTCLAFSSPAIIDLGSRYDVTPVDDIVFIESKKSEHSTHAIKLDCDCVTATFLEEVEGGVNLRLMRSANRVSETREFQVNGVLDNNVPFIVRFKICPALILQSKQIKSDEFELHLLANDLSSIRLNNATLSVENTSVNVNVTHRADSDITALISVSPDLYMPNGEIRTGIVVASRDWPLSYQVLDAITLRRKQIFEISPAEVNLGILLPGAEYSKELVVYGITEPLIINKITSDIGVVKVRSNRDSSWRIDLNGKAPTDKLGSIAGNITITTTAADAKTARINIIGVVRKPNCCTGGGRLALP